MITEESLDAEPLYTTISWKPVQIGDVIIGQCTFIDFEFPTRNGSKMLMKISADSAISDGEQMGPGSYSVWEKAQLKTALVAKQIRAGDNVGLQYVSNAESKGGKNATKMFKVAVERTGESGEFIPPILNVNDPAAGDMTEAFGGITADKYVGMSADAEKDQILKDAGI